MSNDAQSNPSAEQFVGHDPDFTGDKTTQEYLSGLREDIEWATPPPFTKQQMQACLRLFGFLWGRFVAPSGAPYPTSPREVAGATIQFGKDFGMLPEDWDG